MSQSTTGTVETKNVDIVIDCSDSKAVSKYVKNVFVHLKKGKTRLILFAFYNWYQAKPENRCQALGMFNMDSKNEDDEQVNPVFGDKYAIILLEFIRQNIKHEKELYEILTEIVDLAESSKQQKLGLSKLLSEMELKLMKDVFAVMRNKESVITFTAIKKGVLVVKEEVVLNNESPTKSVESKNIEARDYADSNNCEDHNSSCSIGQNPNHLKPKFTITPPDKTKIIEQLESNSTKNDSDTRSSDSDDAETENLSSGETSYSITDDQITHLISQIEDLANFLKTFCL